MVPPLLRGKLLRLTAVNVIYETHGIVIRPRQFHPESKSEITVTVKIKEQLHTPSRDAPTQ